MEQMLGTLENDLAMCRNYIAAARRELTEQAEEPANAAPADQAYTMRLVQELQEKMEQMRKEFQQAYSTPGASDKTATAPAEQPAASPTSPPHHTRPESAIEMMERMKAKVDAGQEAAKLYEEMAENPDTKELLEALRRIATEEALAQLKAQLKNQQGEK